MVFNTITRGCDSDTSEDHRSAACLLNKAWTRQFNPNWRRDGGGLGA